MKFYSIIIFLAFSLIFSTTGCSSDDSTGPETESELNGNWSSEYSVFTGGSVTDSLTISLSLSENGGVVTGTGSVGYKQTTISGGSSSSVSGYFTGSVSGSYSNPNLSITLNSQLSNDRLTFSAPWENFEVNFKGDAQIVLNSEVITFTDTFLSKNQ